MKLQKVDPEKEAQLTGHFSSQGQEHLNWNLSGTDKQKSADFNQLQFLEVAQLVGLAQKTPWRSTADPFLAMRTENILIYRLQVEDQPNSF